tara:strand:+ start:1358 stop:1474 length:117 start_codon:yes stop_codon:yes gene_type:complete
VLIAHVKDPSVMSLVIKDIKNPKDVALTSILRLIINDQ